MNWKQVSHRKHKCPFLQFQTKCTNKFHSISQGRPDNLYCGYSKCEKCPYFIDSHTEAKDCLEAIKTPKKTKFKRGLIKNGNF